MSNADGLIAYLATLSIQWELKSRLNALSPYKTSKNFRRRWIYNGCGEADISVGINPP